MVYLLFSQGDVMETTATANLFNTIEQKFDLAALLKTAASTMAAATNNNNNGSILSNGVNSNASSPAPIASSSPPTNRSSPTNAQQAAALLNPGAALINPALTQMALNSHSPFVPIRPVYAPSGYGRQILIYDSRSVRRMALFNYHLIYS